MLEPTQRVCPNCGYALKRPSGVIEVDGKLVALHGEGGQKYWTQDMKQQFIRELVGIADTSGYQRGWVYYRYRDRFPNEQLPCNNLDEVEAATPSNETMRWFARNLKHQRAVRRNNTRTVVTSG